MEKVDNGLNSESSVVEYITAPNISVEEFADIVSQLPMEVEKKLRYLLSLGIANTQAEDRSFPYSIEFLEVYDSLVKYGKIYDDHEIVDLLEEIISGNGEQIDLATEILEDIQTRLSLLKELNGELTELKDKIRIRKSELAKFFQSHKVEIKSTDIYKIAFAIEKIADRAIYDVDFIFVENVLTFFRNYYPSVSKQVKEEEIIKNIAKFSPRPVLGLIGEYDDLNLYIDAEKAIEIDNKNDWYTHYKNAVEFLCTMFSYHKKAGVGDRGSVYQNMVDYFKGAEGILLPPRLESLKQPLANFERNYFSMSNFGNYLTKVLVENCKVKSEEEWGRYVLASFLLEIISKDKNVQELYDSDFLHNSTNELIGKLCRSRNDDQFDRIEFKRYEAGDCPEGNYRTVISRINYGAEYIPIVVKIAQPKSIESVMRKTLGKGVRIDRIEDLVRCQVFVNDERFISDQNFREKICASIIFAFQTRLGTTYSKESVKNTFENGKANKYSDGLRCFKMNMKTGTIPCELMILRRYPNNHDSYERKMYMKIFEKYVLCSYEEMVEELAEEIRECVLTSNYDYVLEKGVSILYNFILNPEIDLSKVSPNLALNIHFIDSVISERIKKGEILESYEIDFKQLQTRLQILRTLVG